MNRKPEVDTKHLEAQLQGIYQEVWALAKHCEGKSELLLSLLRALEGLHREIREELFQPSLPDTRNSLYELLKRIEESGGWPYIERMRLKDILVQLHDGQMPGDRQEE